MKSKILVLVSGLYLVSRFYHLLDLRIFLDEALYLRMTRDSLLNNDFWVSFSDGKEPLFFWLQSLLQRFSHLVFQFGLNLYFFRTLSVIAGFVLLWGIYLLAKRIGGARAGLLASLIYLISPFFFLYNRLGILDCLLTTLLTLFLLAIINLKTSKNINILLGGLALGLSLLTKTISQFYLFVLPLYIFFFPSKKNVIRIFSLLLIGLAIYLPLILAPGFTHIAQKNQIFTYSLSYSVTHIEQILIPNLKTSLRYWFAGYFGWPMLIILVTSTLTAVKRKNRQILFLFVILVLGWVGMSAIAKIYFPRYLLFLGVIVTVIISWWISEFSGKFKLLSFFIMVLAIMPMLVLQSSMVQNLNKAKIPEIERWQYIYGWPSGNCLTSVYPIQKSTLRKNSYVVFPENGVAEYLKLILPLNISFSGSQVHANLLVQNYYDFQSGSGKLLKLNINEFCQQPPRVYDIR